MTWLNNYGYIYNCVMSNDKLMALFQYCNNYPFCHVLWYYSLIAMLYHPCFAGCWNVQLPNVEVCGEELSHRQSFLISLFYNPISFHGLHEWDLRECKGIFHYDPATHQKTQMTSTGPRMVFRKDQTLWCKWNYRVSLACQHYVLSSNPACQRCIILLKA